MVISQRVVRKAVFPVAGLGTSILPATKAAPKELLTVVDKPLIHYAVEEAAAAGIREMIFVTSRNKRAIEDHFDKAYELETVLALQKRYELLGELRRLFPPDISYACVRQQEALGLGNAIACARAVVGDEPFAVVLADELIDAAKPGIAQLIDAFRWSGQSVLAAYRPNGYAGTPQGFVDGTPLGRRRYRVTSASSSPRSNASELALAGRFIFTSEIFDHLGPQDPNAEGEIDLVDALDGLLNEQQVLARELDGERFDCGTKLGYLAATLHYGLRHPQLGAPFAELVRQARTGRASIQIEARVAQRRFATRNERERLGIDPL